MFSFQVMMQKHNRKMSYSLYISALAGSDTTVLLMGRCRKNDGTTSVSFQIYLSEMTCTHDYILIGSISVFRQTFGLDILGNIYWTCDIFMTPFFGSFMSSTWLIPPWHLSVSTASLDHTKLRHLITIKRAKIIIVCIFVFFTIFNIPHPFLNDVDGLQCVPSAKANHFIGQFHFYLEMTIAFILPFFLLL